MVSPVACEEIPPYLKVFVVEQRPELYTPIDHASWRFILKLAKDFFPKFAHEKYLRGLEETGISTDRIPLISEMDTKLRHFGWRAVAVSGFIAPAAFMEFLSLGILPIACDMRTLEHLAYTPAPDIVHEAAGHAPIISDREYAEYLKSYGELSRKAIFSDKDMGVYEAIRNLSDIKENPHSSSAEIAQSEIDLDQALNAVDYVSEATQLSRMGWWTFEYGLVGELHAPKIYGAGLLSSVGESFRCLGSEVKKIPFSLDCIDVSYDITRPQPQLFVAKDFETLQKALEELSQRMAFRVGGAAALATAKRSGTLSTTVLDSHLQISGVLESYQCDSAGKPAFLKYRGPCQLSLNDEELANQSARHHAQGFSTPIGPLRTPHKSVDELSADELKQLGFAAGAQGQLEFASGIVLRGVLLETFRAGSKNIVLRFGDCTIQWNDQILYQPDWGTFDLACGARVVSVFGGAADRKKYFAATGGFAQAPRHPKSNLTAQNEALNKLYAELRKLRDSHQATPPRLSEIFSKLLADYANDWLLSVEMLELLTQQTGSEAQALHVKILAHLKSLAQKNAPDTELINRALISLKI